MRGTDNENVQVPCPFSGWKNSNSYTGSRYSSDIQFVSKVNVTALANLFGLGLNQIKRKAGQIDLLIGINYSRFHLGETKVKGMLVARKSPLGWVIFGSNAEDLTLQIKQVSLIRLSQSVDMTEFWMTEALGVSIRPCMGEDAKLSAQEREELKIIEGSCQLQGNRWMMKYPWKRSPFDLPDNYAQVRRKLE